MEEEIKNIDRQEEIRKKGFSLSAERIYAKNNFLNDSTLVLGKVSSTSNISSSFITNSIEKGDALALRGLSDYFFRVSGIYQRLCKYLAYLYKYDYFITPYTIVSLKDKEEEKMLIHFHRILKMFDEFEIKKFFGEVALKVIKDGCYYGYKTISKDNKIIIQELPANYCRSKYKKNGRPVVDFDIAYFDTTSRDVNERLKIVQMFPKEFVKAYLDFKSGKIKDNMGKAWVTLSPDFAFKFNLNGEDWPVLSSTIPTIIELAEMKVLDKKEKLQALTKVLVQKLPLNKNNELIFDIDEMAQLHNNARMMLSQVESAKVLTTFAEIDAVDMSEKASVANKDDTAKAERAVYNESGTAQNLFNSDGNLSLDKSVMNDEASLSNLIQQFESFLNFLLETENKGLKKYYFRAQIIGTTIYNYKELSKLYKEQTQLGYSKILPQLALGQSQSSILANAYFENDVLDLVNIFIPPMSSNTTSSKDILNRSGDGNTGRPEKPEGEKSDKTLANEQSM